MGTLGSRLPRRMSIMKNETSTFTSKMVLGFLEGNGDVRLLCLLSLVAFTVFTIAKTYKTRQPTHNLINTPIAKLNRNRKLGHWVPDYEFRTPKPAAFANWNYQTTPPLPYRAFKHKYGINMGIRNMEWDNWFELDNEWEKYHKHKLERIAERGAELYATAPVAVDAAFELLDEMWAYLPQRYPTLFRQTSYGLDNLVTNEKVHFREGFRTEEDPILTAAKLVQDDLAIMMEEKDGSYYLRSGAIILAGFWRLRDKFNMPLSTIHTSGDVPKFKEKLKTGMEKFFIRQTCDKPVVRNNYFIQTDDNLPWSSSIGPEDKEDVGWYTAKAATTAEQLFFRSERQSLRRLPKSGATVFTIRTYFLPISSLGHEPHVPRRLLNGMSTWDGDVQEYKGWAKYKDVLVPYLEKRAQAQEADGLTVENEVEKYPF